MLAEIRGSCKQNREFANIAQKCLQNLANKKSVWSLCKVVQTKKTSHKVRGVLLRGGLYKAFASCLSSAAVSGFLSSSSTYSSELEDISQHLKHIENEAKTYHNKHLKAISKSSPVSVLVHTGDESKKFEIFKAVCMNPGSTTEHLAEIVEIQKGDVLDILIELDRVDRFVQAVPYDDDDFHAKWYRR